MGAQYFLRYEFLYSQSLLAEIWLTFIYPAYFIISVLLLRYLDVSPWAWAFLLMFVYYIFTVIVFGAQFPPFEIILILLLSLPIVAAGYIGRYLRKKSKSSANAT